MKKILPIILIIIFLLCICVFFGTRLVSNSLFNSSSTSSTSSSVTSSVNTEETVVTYLRVCDKIKAINFKNDFTSALVITDDSDKNACYFKLNNEYGLIDLKSDEPEEEFEGSKNMFGPGDVEEIYLEGADKAYWSTRGKVLTILKDNRIITLNGNTDDKNRMFIIAQLYLQ